MEIIYSNMIDLLLEYGNKTESGIIDDAVERFGFPRHELEHNVAPMLTFKMTAGYIEKYKNGEYHLLNLDFDSATGRKAFLEFLTNPLDESFDDKPHMKKLKDAFEQRVGVC